MKKVNLFSSALGSLSIISGLICVGVCLFRKSAEGMDLLFLLPMSFTICCVCFPRVIGFIRDNIGLVILYSTIIVRYLITPVSLLVTGRMLHTLNPTISSFRYACIIMAIELIVVFASFNMIWTKHRAKCEMYDFREDEPATYKLTWTGFVFVLGLLGLFVMRGHASNVFSHLSTWFNRFKDFSELYTYDFIAFLVIKSVVVITLVSVFAKAYHRGTGFIRWLFFGLACVVAAMNTYLYMYDARATLAELFLSTMYMLMAFFPRAKGAISKLFGVTGVLFVILVFAESTLNYSSDTLLNLDFASRVTDMAELYCSGPSVVAKTIDTYSYVRSNMSIDVVWSDFMHGFRVFSTVPFLRPLYNTAKSEITNSLFKASIGYYPYMMPNYSFCTYYFGDILGWLFEIPLIIFLFKFLAKVDFLKKKHNDAMLYYAITYIEVEIGMAFFSENIYLLFHVITGTTIWFVLFFYINKIGHRLRVRY